MKIFKVVHSGTVIIGLMALVILVAGFKMNPVGWMKGSVLQSFGSTSSTTQGATDKPRQEQNASFQVAQEIRGMAQFSSQAQLLEKCQKMPACLAKLEAITSGQRKPLPAFRGETQGKQEPRSDIRLPEESPSLLSWLNPFLVTPAYAQTPVSVRLKPGSYSPPNSFSLYAAELASDGRVYLNGTDYLAQTGNVNENNPNAILVFYAPNVGQYLINVVGLGEEGKGKAIIAHNTPQNKIEDWDFSSLPYPVYDSTGQWDYLTAELLEPGYHYFYFRPQEGSNLWISHAEFQSYKRT
ncbi:MAG: hypothetical protein OEV70_11520 [Nitrospirota bacterium]|nr:hypothetical protein [Nitrospirota bacterium]